MDAMTNVKGMDVSDAYLPAGLGITCAGSAQPLPTLPWSCVGVA